MSGAYSYRASVKSDESDELINTYLLRPLAGVIVRLLYATPVTPNQVTVGAAACGLVAALLYARGEPAWTVAAGLCLTAKDLLDSADGQLARAKGMFSRAGRFLDSIGDIAVNGLVFAAIAFAIVQHGAGAGTVLACAGGFLGMSLRVSYHVFYQTSFLHARDTYRGNRTSEVIREEDKSEGPATQTLQRIFLFLYGWQDRLMERLDRWSRGGIPPDGEEGRRWYADVTAVRISGLIGLGTELGLLTLCSVAGSLPLYLVLNLLVMNGIWGGCVVYRRGVLRRAIARGR